MSLYIEDELLCIMAMDEVNRIKSIFSGLGIIPGYMEHVAVLTSEDASKTRGFSLRQGIKALLFTSKEEWVIVDVPADRKVNQKNVAELLGWSKGKTRMATADEVEEKTGCLIGAVPPFGHKEKIKILVDKTIFDNEKSAFNIGLRTHSVNVGTSLVRKVFDSLDVVYGDFVK
jgi:Ala-tRNA(Pro) deacylase